MMNPTTTFCFLLLCFLFPPIPVAILYGFGNALLLNILLCLLCWLPGVVHALILVLIQTPYYQGRADYRRGYYSRHHVGAAPLVVVPVASPWPRVGRMRRYRPRRVYRARMGRYRVRTVRRSPLFTLPLRANHATHPASTSQPPTPTPPNPSSKMLDWTDVLIQLSITLSTFFFPPSGIIFSQGGWGPDAQWNTLLTLLGYYPGLIHSFMVQTATPNPVLGRRALPIHVKCVRMGKREFRIRALDRVEGTAFSEVSEAKGVGWFGVDGGLLMGMG
ncbi:hypothetical protein P152DRAFT_445748 [Eremomyces bilateralis CBS 781.70]|uniref:Uncharacterized protein n=1 Tax=Eremomyces bilateralis CBS 781.70 TaxID=1392243 RepID=A0A6G1GDV4_9PEZI|nr:uncharacterized protein P152DRAFT_445748 [Eremomyces bilateralis CBS 781.70]KAF1816039.1 hypothetical protein P152DRAFT_445748 [Eremomyces bilateralis CBS 781.70]